LKGDYDHAEPLYQRALEILEKVLGAEHPNTVIFRNNLESCRAEMKKEITILSESGFTEFNLDKE
jgi:hypothetical protein